MKTKMRFMYTGRHARTLVKSGITTSNEVYTTKLQKTKWLFDSGEAKRSVFN